MQNMRILAEVVQSFSLNGHINTHTHADITDNITYPQVWMVKIV